MGATMSKTLLRLEKFYWLFDDRNVHNSKRGSSLREKLTGSVRKGPSIGGPFKFSLWSRDANLA